MALDAINCLKGVMRDTCGRHLHEHTARCVAAVKSHLAKRALSFCSACQAATPALSCTARACRTPVANTPCRHAGMAGAAAAFHMVCCSWMTAAPGLQFVYLRPLGNGSTADVSPQYPHVNRSHIAILQTRNICHGYLKSWRCANSARQQQMMQSAALARTDTPPQAAAG